MKDLSITPYDSSLGEPSMPDGAESILSALPIEEQVKLFSVSINSSLGYVREVALTACPDFKSLIVKDGIVVGAMINDAGCIHVPCYIGKTICTWDAEDNNGAGYKSRTDYTTLLFNQSNTEK